MHEITPAPRNTLPGRSSLGLGRSLGRPTADWIWGDIGDGRFFGLAGLVPTVDVATAPLAGKLARRVKETRAALGGRKRHYRGKYPPSEACIEKNEERSRESHGESHRQEDCLALLAEPHEAETDKPLGKLSEDSYV